MAANDRVKTKQMKKEFDEMRSKVLSDLNIADKPKYPKYCLLFHIKKNTTNGNFCFISKDYFKI